MDTKLWKQIEDFDLDFPLSEYGFSTRLAHENFWTKNFTRVAILEYKKFMYLAATSDLMVSPSEVIDKVWHQHLIFTQSYQDFCAILGKSIQHVPSTHNKVDFAKFHQAKERTTKFYLNTFGEQPNDIWGYAGMFESLELEKSRFKIRTIIIIGLFVLALLTVPVYFMRPLYIEIANLLFLPAYLSIAVLVFAFLEFYNNDYLEKVLTDIKPISFLWKLDPFEVVYLKTGRLSDVVHGHFNRLFEKKVVKVNKIDFKIEAVNTTTSTAEEHQIMEVLALFEKKTAYPPVLRLVSSKPIFSNTANCMDAFMKYFRKSKKFGTLFYLNFGMFGLLFLLGFIRLCTGLVRGKPVEILIIILLALGFLIVLALRRLANRVFQGMIPERYLHSIVPRKDVELFEWQYLRDGKLVMAAAFVPLVNYVDKNKRGDSNSSCTSSCGSSCGSSCSSCGGCGD